MVALQILLDKIKKPQEEVNVMTEEQMRVADEAVNPMIVRLECRYFKEDSIVSFKELIKRLKQDLKLMVHIRGCDLCMAELQIDVERYLGTRCLWYLDLQNDMSELFGDDESVIGCPEFPPELEQLLRACPKVACYNIGSYWTGSSDDSIRFIKDRMAWAEKFINIQLHDAKRYLRHIRKWSLQPPPPSEPRSLEFLI